MVSSINLNYSCSGKARSVLTKIKSSAKGIFKDKVGTTKDGDLVVITYFEDKSEVRFHASSDTHINVLTPLHRVNDTKYICKLLERVKLISAIHGKTSQHKSHKEHEHAFDVLKRNMENSEFTEHILVLPSALEEARECEFEYHGPLDSNLKNLVKFAKSKREPKHQKTLDEHLARQAGLGHFSHAISQTAKIKFPEDYTAEYKGKKKLFEMHVTIGTRGNAKTCMAIYMDWDPEIQKLVIARFGRHGRGADDK